MVPEDALGLYLGAIGLGAVHGVEPGHGWPVAASYALERSNKWLYGFAASFILGVGHLISSIAMVGAFFYAKAYFELTEVDSPITVGGLEIGGPVSVVAGVLLIGLGVREYTHGHGHSHAVGEGSASADGSDHSHDHDGDYGHAHGREHALGHDHGRSEDHSHTHDRPADHDHGHDHARADGTDPKPGVIERVRRALPFGGGHGHSHSHGDLEGAADRGLLGIAWFAFLLGFAHEEEFEIIALCAGSTHCLELMTAYALTVIAGIVGLTMLLIAGYERCEERVKRYTPYLPAFSAAVLIVMGVGFVAGVF